MGGGNKIIESFPFLPYFSLLSLLKNRNFPFSILRSLSLSFLLLFQIDYFWTGLTGRSDSGEDNGGAITAWITLDRSNRGSKSKVVMGFHLRFSANRSAALMAGVWWPAKLSRTVVMDEWSRLFERILFYFFVNFFDSMIVLIVGFCCVGLDFILDEICWMRWMNLLKLVESTWTWWFYLLIFVEICWNLLNQRWDKIIPTILRGLFYPALAG